VRQDDATLPSAEGSDVGAPSTIGRFTIEGVLGRGGMGVVLAGRDPELALVATADLLVPADRAMTERATDAVGGLANVDDCADVTALTETQAGGPWRSPPAVH